MVATVKFITRVDPYNFSRYLLLLSVYLLLLQYHSSFDNTNAINTTMPVNIKLKNINTKY